MKLIKFVIDQKIELTVPTSYIPRMGETVLIQKKPHFVDDISYELETEDLTIHLLSQEE